MAQKISYKTCPNCGGLAQSSYSGYVEQAATRTLVNTFRHPSALSIGIGLIAGAFGLFQTAKGCTFHCGRCGHKFLGLPTK